MAYANLRKMFMDDRIHTVCGRVVLQPGETKHYRVSEEGFLVITCVMLNSEMPCEAHMAIPPGIWSIPDVGDEVMLATDNGDIEGEVYITGVFPHADTPGQMLPADAAPRQVNVTATGNVNIVTSAGNILIETQGQTQQRITIQSQVKVLIACNNVEIADNEGNGVALAKASELDALRTTFNTHVHPVPGVTTGPGATTSSAIVTSVPAFAGTEFLKGA